LLDWQTENFALNIFTARIAALSRYQDRKIAGKFSGGDIASGRGVLVFPNRHGIRPWGFRQPDRKRDQQLRNAETSLLESV